MIGALRKKFIRISVASTLLVFTVILLLLFLLTRAQMNRTVDRLTDAIASNDGVFPEFDASAQEPPAQFPYLDIITGETRFSTRFFTVWLDGEGQVERINMDAVSTIEETEVERYAAKALDRGAERGWIGDYRYKVVSDGERSVVVFVNGTMYKNTTSRLLLTVFLILLGSAILILALTVLISKQVVRPAAESYERQKQFITDANHELKTPLTLILSNLDIVEAEVGRSEWLDDIRAEGERMGLLINQLVTLSRMDESDVRLEMAEFDLSGAVWETVSAFQALAEDRGLTLSAQIAPEIRYRGDEDMLRRVAAILLDNAVKYCDAGGAIQVKLFQRRHPVLTVDNDYREVDRLELERLFDRFYRADRARTFSGSFGIVLSVPVTVLLAVALYTWKAPKKPTAPETAE